MGHIPHFCQSNLNNLRNLGPKTKFHSKVFSIPLSLACVNKSMPIARKAVEIFPKM